MAPYAAAAIGKRFGHGENKNEAAQAIGHFMLGAALAYANGADPLAGGSAAVASERAAEYLAKQYDDGRTAIDPITGKFNPNLLPEHIKEEIKAQTGAVASVVGAAGGSLNGTNGANTNALFNAQVGGVLGQNAVENNALNRLDGFTPGERSLRARADKIYQNNPKGKDLYIRSYEAYELEASYLAAKEIVVGTWEGIRHPWDNTIVPLAEAVSSPVQTVNKVVMSYENWKAVRDEAYINDPQLAGRMDAMFDARVGTNAAFMVVSGGTASAIVRSPAAAKVVKSAGNLSKIVRKAEAPSGKAVPVGEARIPSSPKVQKVTPDTVRSTSGGTANAATYPKLINQLNEQNLKNIAAQDSRLASAINDWKTMQPNRKGEINFGIGSGTAKEADKLEKIWVGDGAKPVNSSSCPGCLLSADGTRLYRPPTIKTNTSKAFNPTGVQANFVIRNSDGKTLTNGHLNIK